VFNWVKSLKHWWIHFWYHTDATYDMSMDVSSTVYVVESGYREIIEQLNSVPISMWNETFVDAIDDLQYCLELLKELPYGEEHYLYQKILQEQFALSDVLKFMRSDLIKTKKKLVIPPELTGLITMLNGLGITPNKIQIIKVPSTPISNEMKTHSSNILFGPKYSDVTTNSTILDFFGSTREALNQTEFYRWFDEQMKDAKL